MKNIITKFVILCCLVIGSSPFLWSQTNLIKDGSFEEARPSIEWTESSTFYDTNVCSITQCDILGSMARTGNNWAWLGGNWGFEISTMEQTLTIPKGSAELRFWLENPESSKNGTDYFQVKVDDKPIFAIPEGDATYATYKEVVLNLSEYADGNEHIIEFYCETLLGKTSFFIDDVSLLSTPAPPAVPVNMLSILLSFFLIGFFAIFKFRKN